MQYYHSSPNIKVSDISLVHTFILLKHLCTKVNAEKAFMETNERAKGMSGKELNNFIR